jgi:hypothetical protein
MIECRIIHIDIWSTSSSAYQGQSSSHRRRELMGRITKIMQRSINSWRRCKSSTLLEIELE